MSPSPSPTEAELAILKVLWARGPSTVREVHGSLERAEAVGYTTVLKLLQIMTEKGLVRRDTSARAHIYEPTVEEASIERRLVRELADRAFEGSAQKLILRALSVERASPEELDAIRALLDQIERGD